MFIRYYLYKLYLYILLIYLRLKQWFISIFVGDYSINIIDKYTYKVYLHKLDSYIFIYGNLKKIKLGNITDFLVNNYKRLSDIIDVTDNNCDYYEYLEKIYNVIIYDNNKYLEGVSRIMFEDLFNDIKINEIDLNGTKIYKSDELCKRYTIKSISNM